MDYPELSCRVCLAHGATIPIFDVKDSPDPDVYSKLCQCLGEKVEDVMGMPRHLCEPCLSKLNSAVQFIQQYNKSERLIRHCLNNNIVNLIPDDDEGMLNFEAEYLDENLFDGSNFFQNDVEGVANKIKIENVEYTITGAEDIEFVAQNYVNCDATIVGKLGECDVKKVSVIPAQENKSDNCSKKAKNLKKNSNSQTKVDQKAKNVIKIVLGQKAKSVDAINNTFPCKTCKQTFATRGKLRHHRSIKNKIKNKCQEFAQMDLPLHKIHTHPKEPIEPKVRAENKTYVCETCGIKCETQSRLSDHHRQKHGGTKKCPQCYKHIQKTVFSRHLATVHATSRNYSCSFCGRRFAIKAYCTNHEKVVHLKTKPPLRYDCKLCDKQCTSKTHLDVHMRSVHTGERPYVCDICKKTFTHKAYLREHILQHTVAKPYVCPICGKGHTGVANVKSHLRHNHRISELDDATLEALSKSNINYLKHMRP